MRQVRSSWSRAAGSKLDYAALCAIALWDVGARCERIAGRLQYACGPFVASIALRRQGLQVRYLPGAPLVPSTPRTRGRVPSPDEKKRRSARWAALRRFVDPRGRQRRRARLRIRSASRSAPRAARRRPGQPCSRTARPDPAGRLPACSNRRLRPGRPPASASAARP